MFKMSALSTGVPALEGELPLVPGLPELALLPGLPDAAALLPGVPALPPALPDTSETQPALIPELTVTPELTATPAPQLEVTALLPATSDSDAVAALPGLTVSATSDPGVSVSVTSEPEVSSLLPTLSVSTESTPLSSLGKQSVFNIFLYLGWLGQALRSEVGCPRKCFFYFRLNMKYLEQYTEFREILVLRLRLAVHFVTLINPTIRPLHFSPYLYIFCYIIITEV
jgi:hypothetical protein